MRFDDRLRDELRRAVDVHGPREEDALRAVKATRPDWAELTVVSLETAEVPQAKSVRTQRFVGALAACALLAGAVALPAALRTRSRVSTRPASSTCGPHVDTGYRSTAVVRVASAPSASTLPTENPKIELSDPVPFALGLCDTARAAAHLRSEPGVGFAASTNASGDLLSLTAVAPTRVATQALAREWAYAFAAARKAEAKDRTREKMDRLNERIERLHRELRAVDVKLARLMPVSYRGVLKFDGPNGGGSRGKPPPLVPENGTPQVLNLAFERIQLLDDLVSAGKQGASLRIAAIEPDVYATFVSLSPPASIRAPHHDTNTYTVLLAVGLLAGGVLLAGSAFWLGRRRRTPQTP